MYENGVKWRGKNAVESKKFQIFDCCEERVNKNVKDAQSSQK